jgi:hypothetical protein
MRNYLFFLSYFIIIGQFKAQKTDQLWIAGPYKVSVAVNQPCSQQVLFDFSDTIVGQSPVSASDNQSLGAASPVTICDRNGNLQLYSDSYFIYNKNFEKIQSGALLSPNYFSYTQGRASSTQQLIILPIPGYVDEHYYIFHSDNGPSSSGWPQKISYSKADMLKLSGLGEMVKNNQLIFEDTPSLISSLTAVRHGNGRDWWVFWYQLKNQWNWYRLLIVSMGLLSNKSPILLFLPHFRDHKAIGIAFRQMVQN